MQKPGFVSSEAHGKYLHLLHLALGHLLIFQCALLFMPGQGGKRWKEKTPSSRTFSVYIKKTEISRHSRVSVIRRAA